MEQDVQDVVVKSVARRVQSLPQFKCIQETRALLGIELEHSLEGIKKGIST